MKRVFGRLFLCFGLLLSTFAYGAEDITNTFAVGTYVSKCLPAGTLIDACPQVVNVPVDPEVKIYGRITVQLTAAGKKSQWIVGYNEKECLKGNEAFGLQFEEDMSFDPIAAGDDKTIRKIKLTPGDVFMAIHDAAIVADMDIRRAMGHGWKSGTYYNITKQARLSGLGTDSSFDLIQLKDDVLYFGENDEDLDGRTAARRPTSLNRDIPLSLVEEVVQDFKF